MNLHSDKAQPLNSGEGGIAVFKFTNFSHWSTKAPFRWKKNHLPVCYQQALIIKGGNFLLQKQLQCINSKLHNLTHHLLLRCGAVYTRMIKTQVGCVSGHPVFKQLFYVKPGNTYSLPTRIRFSMTKTLIRVQHKHITNCHFVLLLVLAYMPAPRIACPWRTVSKASIGLQWHKSFKTMTSEFGGSR